MKLIIVIQIEEPIPAKKEYYLLAPFDLKTNVVM